MNALLPAPRARSVAVALAATAVAAALLAVLGPAAATPLPPAPAFDDLLVRGCLLALAACALWAWLAVLAVVLEAVRTPAGRAAPATGPRAVPAGVRRLVLLACGVALTGAVTGAVGGSAGATPGPVALGPGQSGVLTAGLPYPDRPTDADAGRRGTVVVRAGDTLWSLAAGRLPRGAGDAQVSAAWQRLHADNRRAVPDPDLIRPGQRLRLPADLAHPPADQSTHQQPGRPR